MKVLCAPVSLLCHHGGKSDEDFLWMKLVVYVSLLVFKCHTAMYTLLSFFLQMTRFLPGLILKSELFAYLLY